MAVIDELINQINDVELRNRIQKEVKKMSKQKKFGLVYEEHIPECTPLYDVPIKRNSLVAKKDGKISEVYWVRKLNNNIALCEKRWGNDHNIEKYNVNDLIAVAEFGEPIYPYLKYVDSIENAPGIDLWHTLIEADNYHALQLLEYLYAGKVDCIYIDPPYNSGARDWKYNNDYVDSSDNYRHSKWLSMMEKRLKIAKKLLNPKDSVLIVTIDEKEYLHLGCLLEEMFPNSRIQMISDVINPKGVARSGFRRNDEYLFFVMLGEAVPSRMNLGEEWSTSTNKNSEKKSNKPAWTSMMRRGSNSTRLHSPGCYYAIYVDPISKTIQKIGKPISKDRHKDSDIDGLIQVLPIRTNGVEGCWQVSPSELQNRIKQGRVKLGKETSYGYVVNYLPDGAYADILTDKWEIKGNDADGSIIAYKRNEEEGNMMIAPTQWKIASHNASENGTSLILKILKTKRFTYPKSLYSVHDAINFFVKNKKDALILDFFAGSGTTLHAVNLLNAEDGGNRRCIMVTNNEISIDEEKKLRGLGFKPGDDEWEKLGVARYVTWPRTICSIEGHDVDGELLEGDYGKPSKEIDLGFSLPKANGFKSNVIFFKLGFLDKTSVAVGRQFKELLSVLWMKAGAIGSCPKIDGENPDMLIYPENKMAILLDESKYREFLGEVNDTQNIKTIFIITDSNNGYKEMISNFKDKECYQLYRDYLDNFRINTSRR